MIELKPFEKSDFCQLIKWIESPRFLMQFGAHSFTFPLDEKQLTAYLKNDQIIAFKVVNRENGAVIGHISLQVDKRNNSARIGRVLVGDRTVRGQGIGQAMMEEIVGIGFDFYRVHRVSLGVFDFNIAAISCYEKVGFKKDGLLREAVQFEEEYWNLWEMSILEHEWRILK